MNNAPSEPPPARQPAFRPVRELCVIRRDAPLAVRDGASALSYATRFQQTWQARHAHRWVVGPDGLYYPAGTPREQMHGRSMRYGRRGRR